MSSGPDESAPVYGEHYYRHDCGLPYERNEHWSRFFGGVADAIIRELHPSSVLDIGCAMGFLVEELRVRGVEAWGIDISKYAIENVHESVADYCAVSSAACESLPVGFPDSFDLVTCIEVIEHLPDDDVLPGLHNMTRYADRLLFSSSPDDYTEATHMNVRSPDAWSARLAGFGMWRNLDLDASYLTPWAAVYDRRIPVPPELVAAYERAHVLQRKEITALRTEVLRRHSDDVLASTGKDQNELEVGKSLSLAQQLSEERATAESALGQLASTLEDLQAAQLTALSARDDAVAARARAEQLLLRVKRLESESEALREQRDEILRSNTWRIGAALLSPFRIVRRRSRISEGRDRGDAVRPADVLDQGLSMMSPTTSSASMTASRVPSSSDSMTTSPLRTTQATRLEHMEE